MANVQTATSTPGEATVDEHQLTAPVIDAPETDELLVEELLVEEVSIDGMCGVY